MKKWYLVDEREDHRKQFAQLLRNHAVEVETLPPDPALAFTKGWDDTITGAILDYALHENDPTVSYSGATLAAHLRETYPSRPIVILSAHLREPATDESLRRTNELIDLKATKDEVARRPEKFALQLGSLATGYAKIRIALKEDDPAAASCAILGLDATMAAVNPLKELVAYVAQTGNQDVALTASLLLHELLKFPGPLLAPEHAAITLGVDPQQCPADVLRRHLEPARYRGAFHDLLWDEDRQVPLYWKFSLIELKATLPNLPPALCFICRQVASTLCAECGKPVDGLHSLPAQRGEVAYPECRQARVCGNCLWNDELQSGVTLDPRHAVLRGEVVKESRKLLKNSQQAPGR
jgi:CheY-like chemotaxis protein